MRLCRRQQSGGPAIHWLPEPDFVLIGTKFKALLMHPFARSGTEALMKIPSILFFVLIFALLAGCTGTTVEIARPLEETTVSAPDQGSDQAAPVEDTATPSKEAPPTPEAAKPESDPLAEAESPPATPAPTSPWQDLPFDQFLEESWYDVMRRDPEMLTELGISGLFGMEDDQLTDVSRAYQFETYALYAQILDALYGYARESLTPEQQLNYDIYAYYLEDTLRGQAYIDYEYPITHFVTGVQYQVIDFFTDIHPVTDQGSAEDYLERLSQIDTKFEQVIANMRHSEEAGVITPRMILQWSIGDIRDIANSPARVTPFYTSFSEKVTALDSLSSDQKAALLDAAEAEIESSVIPAFQDLATYLEDLQSRAPVEDGVWQHPDGEAYYTYQVARFTTTDLTPDEIHQLGYDELERIQSEMRLIFDQLGYPSDESLPQLFDRVERDGGVLYGDDIAAGYEAIIADAKVRAGEVFDRQPQADVIVIPGPRGGYYVKPAMDGSRPGAFYAAVSGEKPRFNMASLAYHEAIPGHHTQLALAQELDLPAFRRGHLFTAYVEGWALYAEWLMADLGVYADDPYGDLGRLQYEAFRAARLVTDTGIHAHGWTFDQAVEFMVVNTGMGEREMQFEVARYIAWPAQALTYKIGMNEILRLRVRAEEQLGERFDILEFHNLVIGNGSLPLAILEQIVDDYIAVNSES
jgi:uncharacterized protein (DUF885 family)